MTLHFTDLPDTGPVIEGAAPRYHHGHHPQCHQRPHVHRGRHGRHVFMFIALSSWSHSILILLTNPSPILLIIIINTIVLIHHPSDQGIS